MSYRHVLAHHRQTHLSECVCDIGHCRCLKRLVGLQADELLGSIETVLNENYALARENEFLHLEINRLTGMFPNAAEFDRRPGDRRAAVLDTEVLAGSFGAFTLKNESERESERDRLDLEVAALKAEKGVLEAELRGLKESNQKEKAAIVAVRDGAQAEVKALKFAADELAKAIGAINEIGALRRKKVELEAEVKNLETRHLVLAPTRGVRVLDLD